jgi:TonB family protein
MKFFKNNPMLSTAPLTKIVSIKKRNSNSVPLYTSMRQYFNRFILLIKNDSMKTTHVIKTLFVLFLLLLHQITFAQKLVAPNWATDEALTEPEPTKPLLANSEAAFVGERESLQHFIEKNLYYPTIATDYGIEGLVQVRFMVDIDGSIKHAKVIRPLGFGCDEAVLYVLNKMPRWLPKIENGIAKPSLCILQIKFALLN